MGMAARLGEITSQYRWFSLLYLLLAFFLFPAVIFGLSLAGSVALFTVLIPVAVTVLMVLAISMIQNTNRAFYQRGSEHGTSCLNLSAHWNLWTGSSENSTVSIFVETNQKCPNKRLTWKQSLASI